MMLMILIIIVVVSNCNNAIAYNNNNYYYLFIYFSLFKAEDKTLCVLMMSTAFGYVSHEDLPGSWVTTTIPNPYSDAYSLQVGFSWTSYSTVLLQMLHRWFYFMTGSWHLFGME